MAVIFEFAANNMDKRTMPFRMSRKLRFEVGIACDRQDLSRADDKQVAEILRRFERCGDAMRSLNRRGQVIWKASPKLLEDLADAEREVESEWENEN